MSAAAYGGMAAIALVAAVAVGVTADNANYAPADATVYRIDRTCNFTRTTEGGPGNQIAEGIVQDCSATDEFKAIAVQAKRLKDVAGHAVVKVSYTAPQDGSSQTGELKFDGRDDPFYKLKAGDTVRIRVHQDDPTRIRVY